MANKVPDYIFMRTFPHSNSQKKIVDRTKDDNAENEFTSEVFKNRKGGLHNIVDAYEDEFPVMSGKKEPKKDKGLRKFKGSETIRKLNIEENSED
jgi:hypothetical protein